MRCSVVCSSRCTLLLASGEARPGEDPNQRQAGELDGSSHDGATSAGTTCTSLASTPPIGTAWLRLGAQHCTISRRGRTPAGANDRGRRDAQRGREGLPSVAPRHPENKSHLDTQSGHCLTHTHVHVHVHVHELSVMLTLLPNIQRVCTLVDSPIDPSGLSPPSCHPCGCTLPTPVPYIQPLSPVVALPFDIIPPACHHL